jgi:hypothetical protein
MELDEVYFWTDTIKDWRTLWCDDNPFPWSVPRQTTKEPISKVPVKEQY